MIQWNYNAAEYSARNFDLVPAGDYRVIIKDVTEKVFKTGNEGFEIVLEIPGRAEKLWYYLVLDPTNSQRTNQRLGMFFDSFAVYDTDLSHYSNWVGRDGAVRVKHEAYDGVVSARVAFCLSRSQQKKFVDFRDYPKEQQKKSVSSNNSFSNQEKRFTGFDTKNLNPGTPGWF